MKINNKNKIYLTILIFFFVGIIILPSYFIQNNKRLLERDISDLYDVAKELDWDESNHLNYDRVLSSGIGLGPSYDVLEVLYKTDITLEKFTEKMNNLEKKKFSGPHKPSKLSDYLYMGELKSKLELKSPTKVARQNPTVTVWNFYHPRTDKYITIHFSEKLEEETWLYNKKQLYGNIVEIELNRQ